MQLDFNEEDVRCAAASIFIQYFREAENKARAQAYQSAPRVNGSAA